MRVRIEELRLLGENVCIREDAGEAAGHVRMPLVAGTALHRAR